MDVVLITMSHARRTMPKLIDYMRHESRLAMTLMFSVTSPFPHSFVNIESSSIKSLIILWWRFSPDQFVANFIEQTQNLVSKLANLNFVNVDFISLVLSLFRVLRILIRIHCTGNIFSSVKHPNTEWIHISPNIEGEWKQNCNNNSNQRSGEDIML